MKETQEEQKWYKTYIPIPKQSTIFEKAWVFGSDITASAGISMAIKFAVEGQVVYSAISGVFGTHALLGSTISRLYIKHKDLFKDSDQ